MYYGIPMTHHGENLPIVPDEQLLLPTDPAISVDLSVRRKLPKGHSFEVDYLALRETIDALGGIEDASNLNIRYRTKVGGFMTRGRYYEVEGNDETQESEHFIDIRYASRKTTQRTLQHELTHYIDLSNNPSSKAEGIRAAIGGIALYTSFGITSANLAVSVTSLATRSELVGSLVEPQALNTINETLNTLNNIGSYGSLGTLALGMAFYYAHKREITARKGGKVEAPVVTSTRVLADPMAQDKRSIRALLRSHRQQPHQTHHQNLIPVRHAAAHRRLGR